MEVQEFGHRTFSKPVQIVGRDLQRRTTGT